jgi:hypothetical protein
LDRLPHGTLEGLRRAHRAEDRAAVIAAIDDVVEAAGLLVAQQAWHDGVSLAGYVERYTTEWDGTWMVATFPALDIKFAKLPAPIRAHLESHRPNLEPKPANWKGTKWDGRKAGDYEWFEIQDVISYHLEFKKPKIMYPNMTKFLPFYLDEGHGHFTNDKGFIITSQTESLPYRRGGLSLGRGAALRPVPPDAASGVSDDVGEGRRLSFRQGYGTLFKT